MSSSHFEKPALLRTVRLGLRLLPCLLLASCTTVQQPAVETAANSATQSICAIYAVPETFNGKVVRVSGFIAGDFLHEYDLVDAACTDKPLGLILGRKMAPDSRG